MKTILLLLALIAFVGAGQEEQLRQQYASGDNVPVERQKDILQLFRFVNQPSYYKNYIQIAQSFPVQNEQLYTKPEVVKEFFDIYSNYLISRDAVFSLYNDEHLEQAIALYNLFYYAKDFETLLNVAIWARQNVNSGLFVYSISVALVQRPDTRTYTLPPIYEIFPQYFFNNEVIQQAQMYKQQYISPLYQKYRQGFGITSNYTSSYLYLSKEQALDYFTEDIGINANNYYSSVYYPFWLEEYSGYNQILFTASLFYSQLLAKYYTERATNGLGQVQPLDFQDPNTYQTEFYPLLRFPNGLDFPVRARGLSKTGPVYLQLSTYNFNYTQSGYLLQDFARRLRDSIDLGYVISASGEKIEITGSNGLYYLWNIIRGSSSSINPKYYGSILKYAKYVYGYGYIPLNTYDALPSALELPETALRDPLLYQLYTTLYLYIERYLSYQPSYRYRDLELPGIKIQGFEISKLITYFDYSYVDISNALYVNEQEFVEDNIQVQVRQQRLNNRPFTYKIDVQSMQSQDVTVKVFIGPKYDELNNEVDMYQQRLSFALLDIFNYTLQTGQNIIRRNSMQFITYASDRPSFRQIYNGLSPAYQQEEEPISPPNAYYGLPRRLMLPKGAPNGQMYQLYIYVSPVQPQATLPLLFPLDRNVKGQAYNVPNGYLTDIIIYLKEISAVKNYVL
ncbi:hypothetical protein Trydic_g13983 [Trypoxylus dichotomus]